MNELPILDEKLSHFCERLGIQPLEDINDLAFRLTEYDIEELLDLMIEGTKIFLEIHQLQQEL